MAKNRSQNKKLKAKQRKEAARRKEVLQHKDDAVVNELTQALKIHLQGRHTEAENIAMQIRQRYPNHPEVYSLLGIIAHNMGKLNEAVAHHRRSIELNPNNAHYYSNLGASLNKSGNPKEAVEVYRKAVSMNPANEQFYFNMAIALRALGELEEAIKCYEKVLEINPQHAKANYNLGNALEASGKNEQALAYHEKVQAIDPSHAKARYNKALLNLRLGKLKEGFRDYELRWLQEDAHAFPDQLKDTPIWDGKNLNGGTLLIIDEQGLGDVIQFIRYVKIIKQEYGAGKIYLKCNASLRRLMSSVKEIELTDGDKLPNFDAFTPILSLPYIIGTDLSSIPAEVPYLSVNEELVHKWKNQLSHSGFKIGIVWAGASGHKNDRNRSCPLKLFELLMQIPDTVFYSLQKGRGENELADSMRRNTNLIDLGTMISDFADTAAIMKNLDLVISVDTSPVHLAGALGVKVWPLLPFVPDWRWLSEREDSPWYPTMRLFRQKQAGNWLEVFQRIKEELAISAGGNSNPLEQALYLHRTGRNREAEAICKKVLSDNPSIADAHSILGIIAHEEKNYPAAIEHHHKSISINPGKADYYTNLGAALEQNKQLDEAIEAHKKAIGLDNKKYKYYYNLGMALQAKGDLEEAVISLAKSSELDPQHINSHFVAGNILHQLGRLDEAESEFNKTLALDPNDKRAIYNRSFIYLLHGDFDRGFTDYETRFQQKELLQMPDFVEGKKMWDGSSLDGKTILIHAEQGFGDMIQFIRYAPVLKTMGARVIGESHLALLSLLKQVDAVDEWLEHGKAIPHFDFHAPILSLPHFLGTKLENIPAQIPYLHASEEKIKEWQPYLARGEIKIGFVWAGRENHVNDHNRSCSLKHFEKLMDIKGAVFYSLQKWRGENELAELMKRRDNVIDLGSKIGDFSDSAAIVSQLDLIISVDTAIVHLAGALGKPTWVLLPYVPDWRWLLEREDSPWYPGNLRLFRQKEIGAWDELFVRVKSELVTFPKEKKTADEYSELGISLKKKGDIEGAICAFRQALRLGNGNYKYHFNLGLALKSARKFDEALAEFRRAGEVNPQHVDSHLNAGNVLYELGRFDEAIKKFDYTLSLDPDNKRALYNRSLIYLLYGDFARGLKDYETRFELDDLPALPPFVKGKKLWDGSDPYGKTILIHAEQGFGDFIQFIRYAKLLKGRGARIIGQSPKELLPLLSGMKEVDEWLEEGKKIPVFDFYAPVMSLPYLMSTTVDNIPAAIPYISAPQERIIEWQPKLSKDRMRIGIVWKGRATHTNDANRSLPLCTIAQLFDIPNTSFYSLQKDGLDEISSYRDVTDLGKDIKDFADTAAIISQLDLVICVDTAVAHLAGALGKPVWVLLPAIGDWRWMTGREDSPWYPGNMRLFRQSKTGDWNNLITLVKRELSSLCNEGDLITALGFYKNGNVAAAESVCRNLIKNGKANAEIYNFLSVVLQKQGHNEEALDFLKLATAEAPGNESYHSNISALYRKLERHEESFAAVRKALAINPKNYSNLYNAATSLFQLDRFKEAQEYVERALAIEPEKYDALLMAAALAHKLMELEKAIEYYNRAIAINPSDKKNLYNQSLALLLLGRLKEGFVGYEHRFGPLKYLDLPNVTKSAPLWDGSPLDGRTIFLHTEQGFGDAIQFIRFVPLVREYGGKIIVGCRRELFDLLAPVIPEATWIPEGKPVPKFDVHAPVMSLPYIFGTTLETVPADVPYIKAPAERIKRWKDSLNKNTFNIAIVWSGNPKFPENENRSCPLKYYETLMDIDGVTFYSLQKGSQEKEIGELSVRRKNVLDMGKEVADFSDTAALLAQVDLLISTDTSVPHLAGAMGVKTWLLASYVPDWRWLLERKDSPWYPTMQIFRQKNPGDWDTVLKEVKAELMGLLRK